MFNETSYGLADTEMWKLMGYPTKAAWKQAGRPGPDSTQPIGTHPVPRATNGDGIPIDSVDTTPSGTVTPPAGSKPGGGGLFDNIPPTYLLIGAGVLALMVLKK